MSEIAELLKEGETEKVEFKPSLSQIDKIMESVSAFSKSNQKLGYEEIRKLALETSKVYWDERVCEDASLEDIEEDKVRWFLKEARKQRRLNLSEDAPIKEVLTKLKL